MNILRSCVSSVLRPRNGGLPHSALETFQSVRFVQQKPPPKRAELLAKKAAIPVPVAFVPYHLRPRHERVRGPGMKTVRKRMHPAPMPKVDWSKSQDYTIPRDSILSLRPRSNHHYHNWAMLKSARCMAYLQKFGRVRMRLLGLYRTNFFPKDLKPYINEDICLLPRDSSYLRSIHGRCVVTSRAKSVMRRYRLSRIVWRDQADHNLLSGVLRARWGNRHNPTYWHNIDPDLHGTLRALDPMYNKESTFERDYEDWEQHWHGAVKPFPRDGYNQDIFKEATEYPKRDPDFSSKRDKRSPRYTGRAESTAKHWFWTMKRKDPTLPAQST
ncbi:hypothetical protein BV898_06226 [Hypsibius exemplaris]|uniref:28S ribosomal protein S14, mitochondrial n=1 Tax=Hypsibius exemplaris TaxID=2072580 RepID=A0A1W0WWV3_HYPEX|nr:hypothetical protein BV898_06226 [Hypsibius exemplaris]